MRRRAFLGTLAAALLTGAGPLHAQSGRKTPVVGALLTGPEGSSNSLKALRSGLRDLGYVEGNTVTIEVRAAGGRPEALPELASELLKTKADVIYVVGPAAVRAIRNSTNTIPVVALDLESDPVEVGWASSLARPGGNLTGLFLDVPALAGKWLELLGAVVPAMKRVGVVWDSTTGEGQLNAARNAARSLGLELAVLEVRRKDEVAGALRAAGRAQVRGLMTLSSPIFDHFADALAEAALAQRIPAISMFQRFSAAGGLMAYGPEQDPFYRSLPSYVDRILKGAKPADMPIVQPAKYRFSVNVKTARTLGITLPPSILQQADDVIE